MSDRDAETSSKMEVRVLLQGQSASLSVNLTNGAVSGSSSSGRKLLPSTSAYNVLWAEAGENDLELSYLDRTIKGKSKLVQIHAQLQEGETAGGEWCEAVMAAAYKDVKPRRRLRVLVNPHGGPGKARSIYTSKVEPMLQVARCSYETTHTEYSKHATDIAKSLPVGSFDALVVLSGDGLIHEVLNGFAEHSQPMKAFSMPIAPVPTGSGNGASLNLLGLEEGFDIGVAVLNAIKGKPMKLDLCSVMFGDQRVISFMTQAMGLMSDLDLGTEHMRWMGDMRFMYGFLRGMIKLKACPITLSIKVAESDKVKMVEKLKAAQVHSVENETETPNTTSSDSTGLPFLYHTRESKDDDGWITFDRPLLYLYAGKTPYVARDLMQFPVAMASDGLIDIVAQELTTRTDCLSAIDGADKGAIFWKDTTHYFKAHAFRVTPDTSQPEKQNVAIDGERYPCVPFEVEVHQGLGTLLSPYGAFVDEFNVPKEQGVGKANGRKQKSRGGAEGRMQPMAIEGEDKDEGILGRMKSMCC